jgi:hypothetical protein
VDPIRVGVHSTPVARTGTASFGLLPSQSLSGSGLGGYSIKCPHDFRSSLSGPSARSPPMPR